MQKKFYETTITAWVYGYLTALQNSGHLLKDVELQDLDHEYVNHLRQCAYAHLVENYGLPTQ